MNIILVCINNFQHYILDNIKQLQYLNYKSIYIITETHFIEKFKDFSNLFIIDKNDIDNTNINDYKNSCNLDKKFRNGFWFSTSARFFYIYNLMDKYNLNDVLHIENDVVLYYNWFQCKFQLNKDKIYIPFDTYIRNIGSIIYIPNKNLLKNVLDTYDINNNDMYNFYKHKDILINLPIFNDYDNKNDEIKYVSKYFKNFNYIFDAAAIGQYLDGVDKSNTTEQTIGFINETCVIKYNKYKIFWRDCKPYLLINNKEIPIFNLHIHSKNIYKFIN